MKSRAVVDRTSTGKKPRRKFHFKQIARAVKFTSKLFGRALSRRIKATVLFATETGKSEQYAKKLGLVFGHAFNAQVHCMEGYDITSIEHEALLLVVTSTFGNGDPPENGEAFAHDLYAMRMNDGSHGEEAPGVQMTTPKSFIKANSQMELHRGSVSGFKQLSRIESLRGSATDASSIDTFGPLSNVRFAVFALGSSAYPNFCAFGKYVDTLLGELGGERLLNLATGDEMCGQDQAFRKWAGNVFNVACETFCLDDKETLAGAAEDLGIVTLSEETVRFVVPDGKQKVLIESLQSASNKKIISTTVLKVEGLGEENAERNTMFIEFEIKGNVDYQPGDHVGILACNRSDLVNAVLETLEDIHDPDKLVELQQQKETHTSNGILKSWEQHERLPPCSVRDLFTRFLDITTPPSQNILQYLTTCCSDEEEKKQLHLLATEPSAYEDWRHFRFPTLPETLREFRSARPRAALLAALLTPLQPRFYSISSSPHAHPGYIHLTVAVVTYRTQDGKGPIHYGVCSNFLKDRKPGDEVFMFIRSAPNFHLPEDLKLPIIMIGPGTGIAPFRGFWHHRKHQAKLLPSDESLGSMWLFFGCRTKKMDLYRDEKEEMVQEGILSKVFLALSRETNIPKIYVQGLAEKEGQEIYNLLFKHNGHFYVCGDCTMAEDVYHTLKAIVKKHGNFSDHEVESYMLALRDSNRYHEDIFGITLRTAEIHNKSRESARIRMASQP